MLRFAGYFVRQVKGVPAPKLPQHRRSASRPGRGEAALAALAPLGIEASLAAAERLEVDRDGALAQWRWAASYLLVIATKGGLTRPGPGEWRRDGRPDHLRAACESSLKRLRTDRVDLYRLHSPDPRVPIEDSLGALVQLQREGKIRHIGISNVELSELHAARRVAKIVSVQNRYNLTDRSSEPVLSECERDGIAFLPWSPLSVGSDTARVSGAITAVAAGHRATSPQVAIAWLLARSPVMLPIPGSSSLAHLEENVQAAHLRLSAVDRRALD